MKSNIIKISYKQHYQDEKEKAEFFNKCMLEKNKEINRLKTILKKRDLEIKKYKKNLLSHKNSRTAKNGYKEEDLVCKDLKNEKIKEVFSSILGDEYDECFRISSNNKCDIQSNNKELNGQVKKYKEGQFQQLDRHWIDDLIKNIPELNNVSQIFKDLCEYPLLPGGTHIDKSIPLTKLCVSNYSQETLTNFLSLLNKHKREILEYAFLGTNLEIQPEYLFGVEYNNDKRKKIILLRIKEIINYLETLDFKITRGKTVIVLGDENILSLQRKGGDGGKKSSNQLQIKIIVSKMINKVNCLQNIF